MAQAKPWFSVVQRFIYFIIMLCSIGVVVECSFMMHQAINRFNGSSTKDNSDVDVVVDGDRIDVVENVSMHKKFRKILIASTAIGIVAAVISVVASLSGCLSSKQRLRHSTRYWMTANFFVIIITLLAFILPLCYDPETGESTKSSKQLWKNIKGVGKTALKKTTYSLASSGYLYTYYVILGLYVALNALVTVVSCFLFPCSRKDYDDIDAQSIVTTSSKYE